MTGEIVGKASEMPQRTPVSTVNILSSKSQRGSVNQAVVENIQSFMQLLDHRQR